MALVPEANGTGNQGVGGTPTILSGLGHEKQKLEKDETRIVDQEDGAAGPTVIDGYIVLRKKGDGQKMNPGVTGRKQGRCAASGGRSSDSTIRMLIHHAYWRGEQ